MFVVVTIACGKHDGSPAAPSSSAPAAAASGGATIAGQVTSGSAGTSSMAAHTSAVTGLTVSVVGTSASAVVDASNRFVLQNVPDGDRQLKFTAPGIDAQVGVSAVQASETITLSVSLSGSSATIESQSRGVGSDRDIEGRVESLPVSPAGSFVVAGQTVLSDSSTKFYRGGQTGTFADLALGIRVHVKAQMSGSSLLAVLVEIQNTNADIPVEVNGVIQTFSGTPSAFQMTIENRLLKGDASTEFFGNSVFGDLQTGRTAEVKGLIREGYVYITRLHVNVPESEQELSASIEGILTAKSGTPPTLTVGGTTVTTTASTEVRRRGDVQALSVLALGMTLHVEGIRQPNGSLVARMIQIKDDETGGAFEIQGSVGGLKGTCPAVTFGVNGFDVVTDSATTFTPACSTLKSGSKVTVKGIKQANGTVKASSVTGS
jgi:hypothetical protein